MSEGSPKSLAATAGKYLVGIEVDGGRIRSRGRDPVDLDLMDDAGWLTATGAPGFVVTAVDEVGADAGPDDRHAQARGAVGKADARRRGDRFAR